MVSRRVERVVSGYAKAGLNTGSEARAHAMLVNLLAARLESQRAPKIHALASVKMPWFILGMPRLGTTALHRLLYADPLAQGLE
jgi:hypothetical protein